MGRISVLIVDDSAVSRRLVKESLTGVPHVDIAGFAPDGTTALERLASLKPDLVTLDFEMPGLDGVATMTAIRAAHPRQKVIMISAHTERGAKATIDALARGAADYITKPSLMADWSAAVSSLRTQIVPMLQRLFPTIAGDLGAARSRRPAPRPVRSASVARTDIIAIGVSTGGPSALDTVLSALPADFPVPVVIVQHMPPLFTRYLAQSLSARTRFPVREATGGELLQPATAWIAPGDFHMLLERSGDAVRVRLSQSEPVNSCRPSVDVLFRSVAHAYGPNSLAAILTGMGRDGLDGCRAIHTAGGQIIAQDEESSVVWGMPSSVAEQGLADEILPLEQLPTEILCRVSPGRTK